MGVCGNNHLVYFTMVGYFLGVRIPIGPSAFSFGIMSPDFIGLDEKASGDGMFGAIVGHCS